MESQRGNIEFIEFHPLQNKQQLVSEENPETKYYLLTQFLPFRQQLSSSFASLRQNHELFIIASKAIDLDNHSRLSNGSATEKPLFYYVEHSFDIMYCLSIYEKNIQYNRLHLNVRDSNLINKFLNAISISQNLQDLIAEVLLNSYFIDRTEKVRNKS